MPFNIARMVGGSLCPVRAGYCVSLAALLLVIGCDSLQNATADGDTRTISFHHVHTGENLTVTYKVNGRYDEEALTKINNVLRDWREEKPIRMDPHLIDLVWEVHREVEATEPISIICGYRSPSTNAMLRRRSSGVAKFSQHMLGKALDFYIPGVPLERLREAGLRASRGGVGFYPESNFVHLDTGSVRHWPRMPEAQLARVMAKGPLTAVAAKNQETKTAALRLPNPFAKLFGGQDDEDAETLAAVNAARTAAPPKSSALTAEKSAAQPIAAAVPMPTARPVRPAGEAATFDLASATAKPAQAWPAQAASLASRGAGSANEVISERGFWRGLPDTEALQASVAAKTSAAARPPARTVVAGADPPTTGGLAPWSMPGREGTGAALAYAPVSHPAAAAQSRPAAATAARMMPVERNTTVAVKRSGDHPTLVSSPAPVAGPVKAGQRFNDPWLRAMIVAPSAGGFLSTSLLGAPDYRVLSAYLRKPDNSVMMTFAQDPHLGMTSAKFSGAAVVFVSTVTFNRRTASLR